MVESAYQCMEHEFDPSPGKIIHVGATKSSVPLLLRLACSRAHVMELLSMFAAIIEAHAPRARPLQHEKPLQLNQEWPLLSETRGKSAQQPKPGKTKNKTGPSPKF